MKPKPAKPVKAVTMWFVANTYDQPIPDWSGYTRMAAIREFENDADMRWGSIRCKECGYRLIKCRVTPVGGGKGQ